MTTLLLPSLFGVSIEVYFILLVIAIPAYFFWRWLFRRMLKTDERTRRVVTWTVTLLTTPVVYAALVIITVLSLSYYPSRDFNRDLWFADEEKRYELSEDIIESRILIGKTREEVKKILGEGGESKSENYYTYYLGYRPGLFNIDPDILYVYFKDDKVERVEQYD